MRLSRDELFNITRYKRPNNQVEWFKRCLGINIPRDRQGPILTQATYEAILAKRLGVLPQTVAAPERDAVIHPPRTRQIKVALA